MGARPSSFKKGGGFLNNVAGVITGYQFTDEFNGEPFKAGRDPKTKKEKFHALNCVLSVRVDGADEDVTTTLFVGGYDDWQVSEDGLTLTPTKDGQELGANTAFCRLINSLVVAGFPETNLPEDEFNFEPIIGTRVQFVQRKNEDDTKRLGKRKGKDGKEYDRQDLVIDQVFELPGGTTAAPKAGAKAGKPAAAAKPAAGKGKAAPAEPEGEDLDELTSETLVAIAKDAGGTVAKSKLSMAVLKKLTKHPQREDVRKRILEDEFLGLDNGWTYNKAKSAVTVEADE